MKIKEDLQQVTITLDRIITREKDILLVSHDEDDGMWQFLDNEIPEEKNAKIVSLKEILEIDPSIKEILDMPLGCMPIRDTKEAEWNFYKTPEESEE